MADKILLESGDAVLLEDGSSFLLLEGAGDLAIPFVSSATSVYSQALVATSLPLSFIASATLVRAPQLDGPGASSTYVASTTWLCPDWVYAIKVEVWGGGGGGEGGGGNHGNGAGGGGAYSSNYQVPVTPGTTYTITVAASGSGGSGSATDGGDSSFVGDAGTTVLAKGGKKATQVFNGPFLGGAGGDAASGSGLTKTSGGHGGDGSPGTGTPATGGGGGGEGAGPEGDGHAGTSSVSTNTSGQAGGTGGSGGDGGRGGNYSDNAGLAAGVAPGGGGGGGGGFSSTGANGATGQARITYTPAITPSFIASATVVHAPELVGTTGLPFLSSATTVFALALDRPYIDLPFIGQGAYVGDASGTRSSAGTFTVSAPSGTQIGDVLVLFLEADGSSALTPDSEWTSLGSLSWTGQFGEGHIARAYALRVLPSSPSSWTFNFTSVSAAAWQVSGYRNVGLDLSSLAVESPETVGGDSHSAPTPSALASGNGFHVSVIFHSQGQADSEVGAGVGTKRGSTIHSAPFGYATLLDESSSASTSLRWDWTSSFPAPPGGNGRWWALTLTLPPTRTIVYTPTIERVVAVPFIASTTVLFPPSVEFAEVYPPFIPSSTTLYTPTIQGDELLIPFIATLSHVYGLASLWIEATGAGNGGETFPMQLAPSATSVTATLAAPISSSATSLTLTGYSGLPTTGSFLLTIDDEVLLATQTSTGVYRIVQRRLSNTLAAAHAAGADATWDDHYDMAVVSTNEIGSTVEVDFSSYDAWLIAFDSSQAYIGSDRYATHVAELVGVFPPGTGSSGTNRLDAAQASAAHAPAELTDNCPVGITIPARLASDIEVGDVALLRYLNVDAATLALGPRSSSIQSWYGFMRVDSTNHDVTASDPTATVVDASIDGEFVDEDFTTVTLPGDDRTFTYGDPRYSDKGWPIAALAIRQGRKRVPLWTSPTWHNFTYVFAGFATDATFVQVLINRNGFDPLDPVPVVNLPNPFDIDGPDASWDDPNYFTSTAWYVGIFKATVLLSGPPLNPPIVTPPGVPPSPPISILPSVPPGPGGGGTVDPPVHQPEGGSGGDIDPPIAPVGGERFYVVTV